MTIEADIRTNLENNGISLSERTGQHILVDKEAIDTFVGQIEQGVNVLEIGAGPGNLTAKMADKARKVVAIEIDTRFKPFLDAVQADHPNIEIIYGDALLQDFRKIASIERRESGLQIVSNLPFHISEPFMQKIIGLPVESIVLIVGDQLAERMRADNPSDYGFTKLSLLAKTFFELRFVSDLKCSFFYPEPRTDTSLVVLYPRAKKDYECHPGLAILRNLFLSERRCPSVLKVIKESKVGTPNHRLMTKEESHRYDRRQVKMELRRGNVDACGDESESDGETRVLSEVKRLNLPTEILNKPFSFLDNPEIRVLASALVRRYGSI